MPNAIARLGRVAIDLVFPPRCAACGAGGAFLCAACQARLVPAAPPRCPRCWRPGLAGLCAGCQTAPPPFDGLRAVFVYRDVARELVHALKFQGMSALAQPMAQHLAAAARAWSPPIDAIVPVPLSGLRERTRGYNQALLLARELARELGLPAQPRALRRRRHTPPQARAAGAEERRRNVMGAFEARPSAVRGRALLLIDDVTTTGATLVACAAAAREAGARSVWALAFARED
jgi:ComF family protein